MIRFNLNRLVGTVSGKIIIVSYDLEWQVLANHDLCLSALILFVLCECSLRTLVSTVHRPLSLFRTFYRIY